VRARAAAIGKVEPAPIECVDPHAVTLRREHAKSLETLFATDERASLEGRRRGTVPIASKATVRPRILRGAQSNSALAELRFLKVSQVG
jgi:hypothetical protein